MVILAVRGHGKNLVTDRNYIVKKKKNWNFDQNSYYIPQKNFKKI